MNKKASEFIRSHLLSPESIDYREILDSIISEMVAGLEGRESSLPMTVTYVDASLKIPTSGSAVVIDAGGTNLRSCVVSFDGGRSVISRFNKVPMPGSKSVVTASEFFSAIADSVEDICDASDRIGFCFSYNAEITEDHDGVVKEFSKEIKAPEVIGMRIGEGVLRELSRRGHDVSGKKLSLVNDTVATLLAGMSAPFDASAYIGFILGTGTNTAYVEKNENIGKIVGFNEGAQIINVESGSFDFDAGDLDGEFLETTANKESYKFEKAVSGAYLGPLSAFIIGKAAEEGVISAQFCDTPLRLDTAEMSDFLSGKEMGAADINPDDREAMRQILMAIVERAALFASLSITAAAIKSARSSASPIAINIDGTTFYKTEFLEEFTTEYLDKILKGEHSIDYRKLHVENSPIVGAAISAMGI